jgi:3-phenylpropionate/trans-cinnamate dioxygenase ferredoxin subunit
MQVELCPAAELPEGAMRYFEIVGCDYMVAHLDGRFYAIDAGCTSGWSLLTDGTLDKERKAVICKDCRSAFDLETGKPVEGPATYPVRTYEVEVHGDQLVIDTGEE